MTRCSLSRLTCLIAAGLGVALLFGASARPASPADAEASAGGTEALRIARLLEAGRPQEALAMARVALKTFPKSLLLRRRLAQADLCVTAQLDEQFTRIVQDIHFDRTLSQAEAIMDDPESFLDKARAEPSDRAKI